MTKRPVYVDLTDEDPFKALMELAETGSEVRSTLRNVLLMLLFQRELSEFINRLPHISDQEADDSSLIDINGLVSVVDELPEEIHADIQPELAQIVHLSAQHNVALQNWHTLLEATRNKFSAFSKGPHYKSVMVSLSNLMDQMGVDAFYRFALLMTRELSAVGEVLYSATDELTEPRDEEEDDEEFTEPKEEEEEEEAPEAQNFLAAVRHVVAVLPYIWMDESAPGHPCPWGVTEADAVRLQQKYAVLPEASQSAIEAEWMELGALMNGVNAAQSESISLYRRIAEKLGVDAERHVREPLELPTAIAPRATRRRIAVVGGALAGLAALLLALLLPDGQPAPSPTNTATIAPEAPPVTAYDFPMCEPAATIESDWPSPAVATQQQHKAPKVQLSSEKDTLIIRRKDRPNLRVTVTEEPNDTTAQVHELGGKTRSHTVDIDQLDGHSLEVGLRDDIQLAVESVP